MKSAFIGLGRMGSALACRASLGGCTVVGFDKDETCRTNAEQQGIQVVSSLQEAVQDTDVVWLMVPAGSIVDAVLHEMLPLIRKDTVIIDGGNSFFKDSIKRASICAKAGIDFLDCGTSGGVHGRDHGFSLMVGGDAQAYTKVFPLLQLLAAPEGVGRVGPSGAGHYVKMVHNGIEYGIMQAYAEGFHLLKEGSFKHEKFDLEQITNIWNHGSVIRSWLLQLTHEVFARDQHLHSVGGAIEESGMGSWTADEAREHKIPATVLQEALNVRAASRKSGGNFATKIVAMMRNAFGGHAVGKVK